jgi:spore coat polysaccharide biosynthesis protein SpsF
LDFITDGKAESSPVKMRAFGNVVAIIQARMGSTRLPGKVLMDVGGLTALDRVISRLSRAKRVTQVVIATTDRSADDSIVTEANQHGVACFRGSEQDVLSRYLGAAQAFHAGLIVRITSDCPLIDPEVVDRIIVGAVESGADFASNCIERSYPRGLDAEVFTMRALIRAHEASDQPHQREHVTSVFYERPDLFRLYSVAGDHSYTRHRWTLDTHEDLALIRAIYSHFKNRDDFGWREVIALMERRPELAEMNSHVVQKAVAS